MDQTKSRLSLSDIETIWDRERLAQWLAILWRDINPLDGSPLLGYHPDMVTIRYRLPTQIS